MKPLGQFQRSETELPGVFVIKPRVHRDSRGEFVKTYHEGLFRELGLGFTPCEEFFSVSGKNVVRGMNFQAPPARQARLVYCIAGRILDVVLDLRKTSATFGQTFSREISAANRELIFIPPGFANGFLNLDANSVVVCLTDSVYAPAYDAGIRWDSFGFNWPIAKPIVSERDQNFPAWGEFQSPF